MNRHITILSTADWDNPYWTNKQHVASELARRGAKVLYIESLGLRRPSTSRRDVARIGRRIRRALNPPRQVAEGLWVWSPLVFPAHDQLLFRAVNRIFLALGLKACRTRLGLRPDWLWTYSPVTPALLDSRAYDRVIYHSVDNVAAQPGMARDFIEATEAALSRSADIIFATAPQLEHQLRAHNPRTHFMPNVADFEHFSKALDPATKPPADIAAIPGPRIGFIGAISSYKLDFQLMRDVAAARPDWSFVMVGEVGEGHPDTDDSLLQGMPNIHLLGGRPYATLPAYLKAMDVALLPCPLNEYTTSMFPMKFFEYLAAGRPVVSTRLPALADYAEHVAMADDAEGFVAAIDAALRAAPGRAQGGRDVARNHTYERRTQRMVELIEALAPKAAR